MDNKRRLTNKYILLAILLIAVFVLPSCRTRITNNSEVSNIQYDEDGFLTETYEMRREELGLSTAERPLLPNFGSGDTDSNDDFSEGESIEYNPEDYQEDFTEPETTTNTNTNTTSGTTTRRTTSPVSRSRTSGTTSTSKKWKVTFNANGGKFTDNGKETIIIRVPKGSKIGEAPEATREGYTLEGWFRENSTSAINPKDKVNANMTLYAHWKKDETPPATKSITVTFYAKGGKFSNGKDKLSVSTYKEGEKLKYPEQPKAPTKEGFTITFKGWSIPEGTTLTKDTTVTVIWKETKNKTKITFNINGGEGKNETIEVEDGKYQMPESNPSKKGYEFAGWFTDSKGGTEVQSGDPVTATTVYAHWQVDRDYWIDDMSSQLEGKAAVSCLITGLDDTSWLPEAYVEPVTDESAPHDKVIAFDVKDNTVDESEQEAYLIYIAKKLHGIDIDDQVIEDLMDGKEIKVTVG